MNQENENKPISGYIMLVVTLLILGVSLLMLIVSKNPFFTIGLLVSGLLMPGFFYVNPNGSRVLILFGDYRGTVKKNGFFWVNPFYTKKSISLRARNFDSERIKSK